MGDIILFSIFGVIGVASAIAVITLKNPIASAMSLILHFFALAGIYLTLKAQFIAAMQIIIYAGAIMALALFVIMLLNLNKEISIKENYNWRKMAALALGATIFVQFAFAFLLSPSNMFVISPQAIINGTAESIGISLFSNYLFPFEAISLTLLTAVVGAVLIAKKRIE